MTRLSTLGLWILALLLLGTSGQVGTAGAETKSFYSPIIMVDRDKGYIVISSSGAVFGIEVPEEAKPHLEKLPVSGLIDVVVELRGDQPPLLKRWKVASGETSCRVFDGKECK